MDVIRNWFKRYFSDPQVVILAVVLFIGFFVVVMLGQTLAPALAALVIAYLLEGLVNKLQRLKLPRTVAVLIIFLLFMAFFLSILLGLIPYIIQEMAKLVNRVPEMVDSFRKMLLRLPKEYPQFVTEQQIFDLVNELQRRLVQVGNDAINIAPKFGARIISFIVYLILVPLMIFFFLRDKDRISGWFSRFLPEERTLASKVWIDVDTQLGNYVRGKFWEIMIVGGISFSVFHILGLEYALLLGVFTGLSVLIPYIGATIMTIPVALIAFFQWGWGPDFMWVVGAYLVIQLLDGNLLAPLLLSEVTNLHPVAVIVAILVFGGIWGFWGVFFAIPLGTLVQAVLNAWPSKEQAEQLAHKKMNGGG